MNMDDEPKKKPEPKWLSDNAENQQRFKRSKKHELRVAAQMGGKRVPRSGGRPWSKWDKSSEGGDVAIPALHLELKRTDKASMSLKKAWLDKIREEALRRRKEPGLVVTFESTRSEPDDWLMIPLPLAKRLLDRQAGDELASLIEDEAK